MLPDRNGRVTKTQEELQGVIQEHFENFLRGEPESRAPDWQSRWNQFTNVPRRIQWRQRKALGLGVHQAGAEYGGGADVAGGQYGNKVE